jgi:ribosomal protein S18 acetylase RimI-like enzyme
VEKDQLGNPRLYVDYLATAERYRRQGVATRLVKAAEQRAGD